MRQKGSGKERVRCLNCFERFAPPKGASQATCPKCQMEWRLTWSSPTSVKVRGPVWAKVKGRSI